MNHSGKPLYISKNLKYLTNREGHNQTTIAILVGIERTTWNGYVKNNKRPSAKNLEKISDLFDTSISDLLYTDLSEKSTVEEEIAHYDNAKALKAENKALKNEVKLLKDLTDTQKSLLESKDKEIHSKDLEIFSLKNELTGLKK
jgi:transcriptional regulator with XRE-family HTH domain